VIGAHLPVSVRQRPVTGPLARLAGRMGMAPAGTPRGASGRRDCLPGCDR